MVIAVKSGVLPAIKPYIWKIPNHTTRGRGGPRDRRCPYLIPAGTSRYSYLLRTLCSVATSTVACVPSNTRNNMFNLTRGALTFKFHWHKAITQRHKTHESYLVKHRYYTRISLDGQPADPMPGTSATPTRYVAILYCWISVFRDVWCIFRVFFVFCIFPGTS